MEVYKAINRVQSELSTLGIVKDKRNSQGAGYNFRGIDDVYNAIAPLLAKNGLCILPRVLFRECVERQSKSGGALFYITVEVEFDFVSSEDGTKHTVKTFGEAMDSGDKATNKAMSAAYKYACFQAFSIPTESREDADYQTHEVAPAPKMVHRPIGNPEENVTAEERAYLGELANRLTDMVDSGATDIAVEALKGEKLEADQKIYLWSLLPSHVRSAIKKG